MRVRGWSELDDLLDSLSREVGAQAYVLTDSSTMQLSPTHRGERHLVDRLQAAWDDLERAFGPSFLRNGRARPRVVPGQYLAQPLCGAYLLVMLLSDRGDDLRLRRSVERTRR